VNRSARGIVEHPQSHTLKVIMQNIVVIQNLQKAIKDGNLDQIPNEGKVNFHSLRVFYLYSFHFFFFQALINKMKGDSFEEKLSTTWDELQSDVDHILDKNLNKQTDGEKCYGVKQVNLEHQLKNIETSKVVILRRTRKFCTRGCAQ